MGWTLLKGLSKSFPLLMDGKLLVMHVTHGQLLY